MATQSYRFFRNESCYPKNEAQRNLSGITHYVDNDTLHFHHSRILSAHVAYDGLLFAIVESVSLDMHNTKRGYRPVVFDIFGTIIGRCDLEHTYRTSKQALKAMWDTVNAIEPKAHTLKAIDQYEQSCAREIADLRAKVQS
jgi:hypothetical protein